MDRRKRAIINAYVTAGGIERHKDGIEAAMAVTKLGRSSVSSVMNSTRRNFYKEFRLKMLREGMSLQDFMDLFKARE